MSTTISTTPEEYRALREGCGLADRSWMGRLEILGADRHRFLNAYVTCDVKSLAPGEGAYGFVTTHQGRILSDLVVTALEDRLWLLLPPGQEEAVARHLRKYILADRVEVRPLEDMRPVTLIGPRAAEVLGDAGAAAGRLAPRPGQGPRHRGGRSSARAASGPRPTPSGSRRRSPAP